ncbi:hypothetical protein AAZX31_16G125400 [Glycine max]|uniref:AP complex mu/sigma subunit domain-containing protein n=1 Tax=Glycine max TaxID=3847 RepID=I1MNG1_SOYBN
MKLFAMCFQVYLTLIDLFFLFAFLLSFLVNIVSFAVLCCRPEHVSNFVDAESFFGPDSRLVYKHFATLYFMFIFDSSENELAMLDLIQVFVETLDKCFRNVCELDIVFNYSKMHTILDEIILGGQVLETSSNEVMKAIEEISRLESASNAINLVPKSVSGWRSR